MEAACANPDCVLGMVELHYTYELVDSDIVMPAARSTRTGTLRRPLIRLTWSRSLCLGTTNRDRYSRSSRSMTRTTRSQ